MHSVVYGQTEPPAVNVKNAGAIGGAFVSLLATIGMVLIYVLVCFMLYKKRQLDTGRSQASSTPVGRFMHHCTFVFPIHTKHNGLMAFPHKRCLCSRCVDIPSLYRQPPSVYIQAVGLAWIHLLFLLLH